MSDKETNKNTSRSFFSKLKESVSGASTRVTSNFFDFIGKNKIDEELIDDIETHLIMADVGIETTEVIIDQLKKESDKNIKTIKDLKESIKEIMLTILEPVDIPLKINTNQKPFVILMVGVNGSGKTTSIGKLSGLLSAQNKTVMLAAADTFRAAAVEQLEIWAIRNQLEVISQETGADPGAVSFDAYASAQSKNIDILMVDTAGRLHTQQGLMDELIKIKRILNKQASDSPHEIMLVIDASLGQNALLQAIKFNEALGITGLIITKLDGSAKGGIILSIANELKIPIRYIGIGEKASDMQKFDRYQYVDALLNYSDPSTIKDN